MFTCSAAIWDNGSMASCLANRVSGSHPSSATHKGSSDKVDELALLFLLCMLNFREFRFSSTYDTECIEYVPV